MSLLPLLCAGFALGGTPTEPDAKAWMQWETASGGWGGIRTRLAEHGVEFSIAYTGEIFGVASGGLRRGAVYDGLVDAGLALNFEKLIGWKGLSGHLNAFYPHGESGTGRYGGDLGTFSNIDFYDSYRLFEAWLQQEFFQGRLSLRAGLMAIDKEFGVGGSDYSSLFINSDFGADIAMSANMPAPIYAIAAPGLRLKVAPTENFYLMGAVYDGNPAPGFLGDPSPDAAPSSEFNHFGTHWAVRRDEGLLFAAEIGWSIHAKSEAQSDGKSAAPEPGYFTGIKFGMLRHTDKFADAREAIYSGSVLAPRHARSYSGNYGFYALFDQELWREPGGAGQGLGFFARGMSVPRDRNFINFSVETGLVYQGALPGRDHDRAGLGVAWAHVSPAAAEATRRLNQAENSRGAAPDYEMVVELSYCAQMTPWLVVQPDIQYIVHPGGSAGLDNALVAGLRAIVTF